jgi:hypothetical protein
MLRIFEIVVLLENLRGDIFHPYVFPWLQRGKEIAASQTRSRAPDAPGRGEGLVVAPARLSDGSGRADFT